MRVAQATPPAPASMQASRLRYAPKEVPMGDAPEEVLLGDKSAYMAPGIIHFEMHS